MQLLHYLFLQLKRDYYSLLFIVMPSLIANSFHIGQYCLLLCSPSSFLCGHPCILYAISTASVYPCMITSCMSWRGVHIGMFTEVLMALPAILIHAIFWSLIFVWLLWHSQSIFYKSGPGLYIMKTLYFCIHSILHHNLWDSVAISFLKIVTNGLWLW